MTSGIGFFNRKSWAYRRRRGLPGLVVIVVFGLAAVVIWARAISTKTDVDTAVRCTPAATPPAGMIFTSLTHSALDDAAPIPPDKVAVKVLNAGQGRGEASIATESLRQLGFTQVAAPDNDPAYPNGDAKCNGQIRFGDSGTSAARTLSLIVPCAELVKDTRRDATVDLAIGNGFGGIQPTQQAREVLRQLTNWAAKGPDRGNDQSAATGPVIDHDLLTSARQVACW